jgi:hypothetical protein
MYPEVKAYFATWPQISPLLAKQTDDVYRYALLAIVIQLFHHRWQRQPISDILLLLFHGCQTMDTTTNGPSWHALSVMTIWHAVIALTIQDC